MPKDKLLIVGPNNSGKTSLLLLLDWALNQISTANLTPGTATYDEDLSHVLPARASRHKARRLTLMVKVANKKSRLKFGCDSNGEIPLRINIRTTPRQLVYVALGRPARREPAENEKNAIELLARLQASTRFIHIPSFRDADSNRFKKTLREALQRRIEARALHDGQGGTSAEYRKVRSALEEIRRVLLDLSNPLWSDVKEKLPPGLVRNSTFDLKCPTEELLRFLEPKISLGASTGDHDSSTVDLTSLGSGLQSLLDLAIRESELLPRQQTIIAAEEPEAFLHPSAIRVSTGRLFRSPSVTQTIVTTHSPIVLDEAKYGDVVICRNHTFYQPAQLEDQARAEINTALLSGYGAEMLFAQSVLLVEGEGDRLFFEKLRRRISRLDESGSVDRCYVIPVGSNTAYAPWIRMLESYGKPADRPIQWIASPDGDASTELLRAFRDANISFPKPLSDKIGEVSTAKTELDFPKWRTAVRTFNTRSEELEFPLHFLSLDLEEAILGEATNASVSLIANKAGFSSVNDKATLLAKLGSKGFSPPSEPVKAPWIRGFAGEVIAASEIPPNTKALVTRWLGGAMTKSMATALMKKWKEQDSGGN